MGGKTKYMSSPSIPDLGWEDLYVTVYFLGAMEIHS